MTCPNMAGASYKWPYGRLELPPGWVMKRIDPGHERCAKVLLP